MGISYKVADWLKSYGHDSIHLSDVGLHTMPDDLIIEKAMSENRIILTADMDFGQILAFTKTATVSVIQFRLSDLSPSNVTIKLQMVLDKLADQLNSGYLIITVQENKVRFKNLPL